MVMPPNPTPHTYEGHSVECLPESQAATLHHIQELLRIAQEMLAQVQDQIRRTPE